MRILVVNQFFWPDVAPTGQYLCDLTRYLSAEGHAVTVICSGGTYAETEARLDDPPPVKIIRIPGSPYKRGSLARLVSYATFFAGAFWQQLRLPLPDLVVSMTTPPLLATAGAIVKALRGTRHFIWEMDVFPDALVSLGALKQRSPVTRILSWIQAWTRRHSDGIIVLGPCMKARLLKSGTPPHLIHVAENWADGSLISAKAHRTSGPLNVFYSGNLGLAHDVDTIANAMRAFRNDARFLFTFAGSGVGRDQLKQMCAAEGIENVRFPGYASREDMNGHLAQADIGLVTERPACSGTVVPSKTYGLLAAGRPILFIGPKEATPALLIERFQCGWQIEPGGLESLIQLLESLSANRQIVLDRGQRARAAFEQDYDLAHGVARVAAALGLPPANQTTARRAVQPGQVARFQPVERT